MMSADEHLEWARTRAHQYIELKQPSEAVRSFTSDLAKHPDTFSKAVLAGRDGTMLLVEQPANQLAAIQAWLNSFS